MENLIEVEYRVNGKLLCTVWSMVAPPVEVGKYMILGMIPSNREKQRRPAQEYSENLYFVEKVTPYVLEMKTNPGHFTHKVEVKLREATDADRIESRAD